MREGCVFCASGDACLTCVVLVQPLWRQVLLMLLLQRFHRSLSWLTTRPFCFYLATYVVGCGVRGVCVLCGCAVATDA